MIHAKNLGNKAFYQKYQYLNQIINLELHRC